MSRACSICSHIERAQIERDLALGCPSIRTLASQHRLSETAIRRHRDNHLSKAVLAAASVARDARELQFGGGLIEQCETLRTKAAKLLNDAERGNDIRAALLAMRELSRLVELMAKLAAHQLGDDTTTINIGIGGSAPRGGGVVLVLPSNGREGPTVRYGDASDCLDGVIVTPPALPFAPNSATPDGT